MRQPSPRRHVRGSRAGFTEHDELPAFDERNEESTPELTIGPQREPSGHAVDLDLLFAFEQLFGDPKRVDTERVETFEIIAFAHARTGVKRYGRMLRLNHPGHIDETHVRERAWPIFL